MNKGVLVTACVRVQHIENLAEAESYVRFVLLEGSLISGISTSCIGSDTMQLPANPEDFA